MICAGLQPFTNVEKSFVYTNALMFMQFSFLLAQKEKKSSALEAQY